MSGGQGTVVAKGATPDRVARTGRSVYPGPMNRWNIILLILMGLTAPAMANPVTVDAVVSPGANGGYTLSWYFEFPDDWHLYGPFQNDSGFPPRITMDLADGWERGPIQWPVPSRHVSPGDLLDHVYPDDLILTQSLTGPLDAVLPDLTARLQWLVCREMCVAGDSTLTVRLADPPEAWTSSMEDQLSAFPAEKVTVERNGSLITITVPRASLLRFAPFEGGPRFQDLLSTSQVEGNILRLELSTKRTPGEPLSGVLSANYNKQNEIIGLIVIE